MASLAACLAALLAGAGMVSGTVYRHVKTIDDTNFYDEFRIHQQYTTRIDGQLATLSEEMDGHSAQEEGVIANGVSRLKFGAGNARHGGQENPRLHPSVRIELQDTYATGLFIVSFNRLPRAECGSSGAFGFAGMNGTQAGAVDIYNTRAPSAGKYTFSLSEDFDPVLCIMRHTDSPDREASLTMCESGPSGDCTVARPGEDSPELGGTYALELKHDSMRVYGWSGRAGVPGYVDDVEPDTAGWRDPYMEVVYEECDGTGTFPPLGLFMKVGYCDDEATQWDSCRAAGMPQSCTTRQRSGAFNNVAFDIDEIRIFEAVEPSPSPAVGADAPDADPPALAGTPTPKTDAATETRTVTVFMTRIETVFETATLPTLPTPPTLAPLPMPTVYPLANASAPVLPGVPATDVPETDSLIETQTVTMVVTRTLTILEPPPSPTLTSFPMPATDAPANASAPVLPGVPAAGAPEASAPTATPSRVLGAGALNSTGVAAADVPSPSNATSTGMPSSPDRSPDTPAGGSASSPATNSSSPATTSSSPATNSSSARQPMTSVLYSTITRTVTSCAAATTSGCVKVVTEVVPVTRTLAACADVATEVVPVTGTVTVCPGEAAASVDAVGGCAPCEAGCVGAANPGTVVAAAYCPECEGSGPGSLGAHKAAPGGGSDGLAGHGAGSHGLVDGAGSHGLVDDDAGSHGLVDDDAGSHGLVGHDASSGGLIDHGTGSHGLAGHNAGSGGHVDDDAGSHGLIDHDTGSHGLAGHNAGSGGLVDHDAGPDGLATDHGSDSRGPAAGGGPGSRKPDHDGDAGRRPAHPPGRVVSSAGGSEPVSRVAAGLVGMLGAALLGF